MNNYLSGKVEVECKSCGTKWMEFPDCIHDNCPFCKKPINATVILNGDTF